MKLYLFFDEGMVIVARNIRAAAQLYWERWGIPLDSFPDETFILDGYHEPVAYTM